MKESTIPGAGVGIFADEFIPKGKTVWKYYPEHHICWYNKRSLERYLDQLSYEDAYKYLIHVYEWDDDMVFYEKDDGRYINHSFDPNIYDKNTHSYAIKDVNPGEEILDNYLTYPTVPWLDELYKKYNIWEPQQNKKLISKL